MNDYTKLSNLVNGTFTITNFNGYKWKMWDSAEKKMLVSDVWQKDYRKVYSVETDKGLLDLSASQVGVLLETVVRNGVSDLNNQTFQVKSNGKTGMEIRYFFNVVRDSAPIKDEKIVEEIKDIDDINLDDIVF
jgi:hypothetical protein